jgi:hypothetical protein
LILTVPLLGTLTARCTIPAIAVTGALFTRWRTFGTLRRLAGEAWFKVGHILVRDG